MYNRTVKLPSYLTTVTKFSKTVALILFIILPFFWFFIGYGLGLKSSTSNGTYCLYQQQIKNRDIQNPSYIQDQISKTITLGNFEYGLVRRPNMNFPIFGGTSYAGILRKALGATDWGEYLRINSTPDSAKNNPYNFWLEKDGPYLLVVDQNGAGSGEGIAKLARIDGYDKTYETVKCFYYVPERHTDLSVDQILQLDGTESTNCTNYSIEFKY